MQGAADRSTEPRALRLRLALARGPGLPRSVHSHKSPLKNWFAWVHLYDPHEPYRAPEPYASQHEPYDAEVAYTDAMVGELLDALRAAGQLDRTLIVVTADHGESLGEHGERRTASSSTMSTMRVPWFIWIGSGRARGSRFARVPFGSGYCALVRLIDLAPTVLDLLGIAAPPSSKGSIGGVDRADRCAARRTSKRWTRT